MTDQATDESAPAPDEEPAKKSGELTDQQLEGVTGAAGRQADCEGYAYMTTAVLKAPGTSATLKSE
jgi:hypothetical protein